MDILPTNVSSFRTSSYWNRFYSNPKLKEFEWYIDIREILGTFYKCIVERDLGNGSKEEVKESVVVNIGCGNSNLSDVLLDEGFKTIYNLDFSQQVLDEMKEKSGDRAHFVNVDVSKKEYEEFGNMLNEKYLEIPKIIVDKAFMDAFVSIDENESKELIKTRAKIYLENTFKMMRKKDVFIIISVSQDYVVAELMRNLLMKRMFVDIYPVYTKSERKAHMIQFIYAIYKYEENGKTERKQCVMKDMPNMPTEEFEMGQLLKKVKTAKTTLYLGPTIRKHTPERRLAFDIFPSNQTDTCFTVVVYDSDQRNTKMKNACIIVPAAQEHLWLYSTSEGNQELAMTASCSRLLLIWLKYTKDVSNLLNLSPLDSYNDEKVMEYIKRNLAETLDNFSLEKSSGITIMKVGESARIRGWICEIPSKYAGKVIVRDVYHEETSEHENKKKYGDIQVYARQMIFSSNPQVIQSEVLYFEHGSKKEFLFGNLTNEYHAAITLAMGFVTSERRVLILGGGTGVLTNVLLEEVENKFVVVELDEAVLKVATEYFGYKVEESIDIEEIDHVEKMDHIKQCANVNECVTGKYDSNVTSEELKVVHYTGDALEFIRKSKGRYAAIILDINNSSEQNDMENADRELESGLRSGVLMSPSPEFLEPEALDKLEELLEENRGILILNMLTRSRETRKAVLNKLSEKFKFIAQVKTPNDINEVLICSTFTIANAKEVFRNQARKLEGKKKIREGESWVDRLTILKK